MKKNRDYVNACALCEHSCYVEYDEKYICKYKNRCLVVDDDHSCRHFRFDLLKLEPAPKCPYTAQDVEIGDISDNEKDGE